MPIALLALLQPLCAVLSLQFNQVALEADGPKSFVVRSDSKLSNTNFVVRDVSDNHIVWQGTLAPAASVTSWENGMLYYVGRFDSLHATGRFRIDGAWSSSSFAIGKDSLVSVGLREVLGFFHADRWIGRDDVLIYGSTTGVKVDMQGGWMDATGDRSKYLSHLSYSNELNPQQIPMSTWALAFAADRTPKLLSSLGILDSMRAEALWGADYLVRSLSPEGYFYSGVFDRWNVDSARMICAFTGSDGQRTTNYQAAWREGAGLSIAALARTSRWGLSGSFSSDRYLEAAKQGYAHLKSKGFGAYDDDGIENILDHYCALMAASELYAATGSQEYLDEARIRAQAMVSLQSDSGWFHTYRTYGGAPGYPPFYHAVDAGLPMVAMTRYLEIDPQAESSVENAIRKHLAYLIRITGEVANPFGLARQTFSYPYGESDYASLRNGFFMPHKNASGYWWQGENARLASLAAAAFYAGRRAFPAPQSPFGIPDSLLRFGMDQIDWILGKNPYGYGFMSGPCSSVPGYVTKSNGEHRGGIVNGITGSDTKDDGSGIVYKAGSDFPTNPPYYTSGPWLSWRWTEQWIPHAHWFLVAMAGLADEVKTPIPTGVPASRAPALRYSCHRIGNSLEIHLTLPAGQATDFTVSDLSGRLVAKARVEAGGWVARTTLPQGHTMLVVSGGSTTRLSSP